MVLPRPPSDWADVSRWDEYWREVIARRPSGYDSDITPSEAVLVVRGFDRLRDRGARRALVVGNGITLLPRALAHAGLDAVALDVSSVATAFAEKYVPSDHELSLFFQEATASRRPGGRVTFVCGDMCDPAVAPGPFDVIYSCRSLQGFGTDVLERAVEAIDARLARGGEVQVWVQNIRDAARRIEVAFARRGYVVTDGTAGPGTKSVSVRIVSG